MPSRDEVLITDPAAAWDAAAAAWDEFVETGLDYWRTEVHGPALLAACGDVHNQRVLDLGCGQGWFSRQLAQRGAHVVGVDFSAAQIANARRHEAAHPLGIVSHQLDAMLVDEHWPLERFDLVTACMALHDSPDTARILAAARQVLTPVGRMAFSIVHPVAAAPVHEWVRDDEGRSKACGSIATSTQARTSSTGTWPGSPRTGPRRSGTARLPNGAPSSPRRGS